MQFTYPITVDPDTESDSPKRLASGLCRGTLSQVSVYFPFGCAGLVGVRIIHYEHQLYPTNPGEWFTGNDILIEFPDEYLIDQGWTEFKVEAYNEDDFYSHTPVVSFVVLPVDGPFTIPETWIEG